MYISIWLKKTDEGRQMLTGCLILATSLGSQILSKNFNFDLSERGMLLVYKCLYQKCHIFKNNVFD